jgi:hypothetical protein
MSSAGSTVRPSNSRRSSARLKTGKQSTRSRDGDPDPERVRTRDRPKAERHKLQPPHTKDLSGVSVLTNFLRPHPAINSSTGFPFSMPQTAVEQLIAESPAHGRTSIETPTRGDRGGTPRRERHRDSTRHVSRSKIASSSSSPTKNHGRGADSSGRPSSIGRRRSSREADTGSDETFGLNINPSNHLAVNHSPSRRSASDVTAVAEAVTQLHSPPQSHKKNLSSGSSLLSSTLSAAYQ